MDGHEHLSLNQELYAAVVVLEQAIEMHTEWLGKLHENLICKQPVSADILHENAHQLCSLGQWYYRQAPPLLRKYEEFDKIESIHRLMHDYARGVALNHLNQLNIDPVDYRRFITAQHELLHILSNLKEKILLSANSFDELTGAVRREAFSLLSSNTHAEAERYKQAYSVAMIDIDHFKNVNDSYGHIVGDEVIKAVAQDINSRTRKTDILCRFGGEEFLLLLPKTTLDQSKLVMTKLRSSINNVVIITNDKRPVSVTVSAGLAQWEEGLGFDEIVEKADQKLFSAKQQGRDRVEA